MSPKIKILSGKDLLSIFREFGFQKIDQRGSHVKLRKITEREEKQTLTIPLHDELDKGTLKAIYRQALKYISEELLYEEFYSE